MCVLIDEIDIRVSIFDIQVDFSVCVCACLFFHPIRRRRRAPPTLGVVEDGWMYMQRKGKPFGMVHAC